MKVVINLISAALFILGSTPAVFANAIAEEQDASRGYFSAEAAVSEDRASPENSPEAPIPSPLTGAQLEALRRNERNGYDFSTFSGKPILGFELCEKRYIPDATTESGHRIKMLGAAIVYFAPGNGQSVFGHVAERFSYCRDSEYFDVVYDYAPFDTRLWNESFERLYGVSLQSFTKKQRKNIFDSLFVQLNFDPASFYADQQVYGDRTIYEAWFKLDGETMYRMMLGNLSRYEDQVARIRAHQPLPEYTIPSDNCLMPVKKDFDFINPGRLSRFHPARLTPTFFYNYVKKKNVAKIIMYPSLRQFRLLKLRAEGKTTAFQWFMPTSEVSGNYPDSWALIFPGTHYNLLRFFVISPLSGAVNLLAGVAEMVYGVLTIPLNLLGQIPGLKWLYSEDRGLHRFQRGWADIFASTLEIFSLQLRYPEATEWTEEERAFIQNFGQDSVLLKYLGAKFKNAPLIVEMAEPKPSVDLTTLF
jgi:hypothetical protein